MRTETEHTIFLKDYAPSAYKIDRVELDVKIGPVTSRVRALLTITPRPGTAPGTPLVLDGDDLKLDSIAMWTAAAHCL
jgi:aminopeptidase N